MTGTYFDSMADTIEHLLTTASPCPQCGSAPEYQIKVDMGFGSECRMRCTRCMDGMVAAYRYYGPFDDAHALALTINAWNNACEGRKDILLPGVSYDLDELLFGRE